MRRVQRGQAAPNEAVNVATRVTPSAVNPAWQSVILVAEERMTELRRTLEWARQFRMQRARRLANPAA